MGIKHFFIYFKKYYSKYISNVQYNSKILEIDNLMIDMNGIFHTAAQKVYEYGNFKPPKRLLKKRKPKKGLKYQIRVFELICEEIEKLLILVNPTKRIILCVDGTAPLGKQCQQRQRRYKSALESSSNSDFDSTCITPGTKFMDYLTKYIDYYIRKQISQNPRWKNLHVIFSNEKSPGEGEHGLLSFVRKYCESSEKCCLVGLDADLIMLTMGSHIENFYILREDLYGPNDFLLIDIGGARNELCENLNWGKEFKKEFGVYDFILICFLVGNDFLPNIPNLEILRGGIEQMISIYKNVGEKYGHLTFQINGNILFSKKSLEMFLTILSQQENDMIIDKFENRSKYFKDSLMEQNIQIIDGRQILNIQQYKKDYYKKKLLTTNLEKTCHDYIEGIQWILGYYIKGVPSWTWKYSNLYAPFLSDISKNINTFSYKEYGRTCPTRPFLQLLCVLPPKSSKLLPHPLSSLLKTELSMFCPTQFDIDLSGKRAEWEGIPIIPQLNFNHVVRIYEKYITHVDRKELKRNVFGKSFVYIHDSNSQYMFKSYYGNFLCKVKTEPILL